MRRRPLPTAINLVLAIAALAMLGSAGLGATPAAAANADACGVVTQHTLATAFGLSDAIPHKAVLREPGNPAGVIHTRCRVLAWKGAKPNNAEQRKAGLLAGTVAELRIEAWVADSGPSAQTWLANFPKKVEGLKSRAKAQFIEGSLDGTSFKPPPFGAQSALGYKATVGGRQKLRAFWWNRQTGMLLSFNATEARGKPLVSSIQQLAAKIVPGVS